MIDHKRFWVEVDENGDPTDFVMLDVNYHNVAASDNFNKNMVEVEHNMPSINENQDIEYNGFSKKEDGSISKDWTITTFSTEECLSLWVKGPRDMMLMGCDWTQSADSPLSTEDKTKWATYRQELRDLPNSFDDSNPLTSRDDIVWPTVPGTSYTEPPSEEE